MVEFIIDVNFSFNPEKQDYPNFVVNDLLSGKNVSLVRGGTKYDHEVRKKSKLVELFNSLSRVGKVRRLSNEQVDQLEEKILERMAEKLNGKPKSCDDPHIFALSLISGCRRVISKDHRMAECRDKIRGAVGHDYCPDVSVICTEQVYKTCF